MMNSTLEETQSTIKVTVVQKANFSLEFIRLLFFVQLLFVALKLMNVGIVATWVWWWVMMPTWVMPVVLIVAVIFAAMITVVLLPFRRTPGETTVEQVKSD